MEVGRRLAVVVLVAVVAQGCTLYRLARGPVFSERPDPADVAFETADHRRAERLRLVVFGDAGTGAEGQRLVAASMAAECAAEGGCDFGLVLGDNVYPAGVADAPDGLDPRFERRFEAVYRDLGAAELWIVPGNHDWLRPGSVDRQVRYSEVSPRWRMPSHDYAVAGLPDWLHVYGLATTKLRRGRDDGQLARAREALCGTEGWRLLFGHHGVYTSGLHADRRGVARAMERALVPLLEECAVHFYFAGHDHHQEHLTAGGFEQVIQGAAAKLRRVRRIAGRPPGVRQHVATSRLGFALVEVTPSDLTLRFFGHDADGAHREMHCRHYRRDAFETPATRSTPCERD